MKIDSAQIKNFKNVSELFIEPGGHSFVITGGNGTGKSSVIQALLGTLAGELPKEVVGPDGQLAEVIVNIKDENQAFHIAAKYQKNSIKGKTEGKLEITNQDGEKVGIKAFRYLIGNATFDVKRDFLSKSNKDKVEFLKQVTGKAAEINAIERKRKEKFDERTEANRRVRDLEGELKGVAIDSKLKFIDPEPVKQEMAQIAESLKRYNHVENGVNDAKRIVSEIPGQIGEIDQEIKSLEEKIAALNKKKEDLQKTAESEKEKIGKGEAWLAKNHEPDMESLNAKLDEIAKNNKDVEQRDAVLEKHKNLKDLKVSSDSLTKEIGDLDTEKSEIISKSELPVEGLTFNDDGVFLDGLPFEEGQINTAKIQEVGFMLFRSLKNNIKVIKLDMNDMDKDTYRKILEMADESGTQVILERVSWDAKGDFEIKFTEEYL